MNCADCFHYEACHRMGKEIPAESCGTFKDRRHVLDLPCEIGGTLWLIVNKRSKPSAPVISFAKRTYLKWSNLETVLNDLGRTVFRTQEEALRALNLENPKPSASVASAERPDCVHYPKDGAPTGCDLLTERFCETRGRCSFCKSP